MKIAKPLLALLVFAALFLAGCTATGDSTVIEPDRGNHHQSQTTKSSDSKGAPDEMSSAFEDSTEEIFKNIVWYSIPGGTLTRGSAKYSVNAFKIMTTEVTQELYKSVMGDIPKQSKTGADLPVTNVSWYDAVLFCNAFSKYVGYDTVYSYESIGEKNYLKGLEVDLAAAGFRLPTETEWEIAARGGTSSTYYWGTAEASDYANYAQNNKGVIPVASLLPNEYSLYDMAGNVEEWINDWYDSYPSKSVENYAGPETGTYRCVRGGSWSDVVKNIAPDVRNKLDPMTATATLGFRVVYSMDI